MKKDFSKTWNSSKQPRKQRKFRANAPKHVKGKFMTAHLSQDLREKYGTRSLRLRKGDTVKVMRGSFRGETGDVQLVDVDRQKVYIDGLEVQRRDGSKAHPPVKPSNLMITDLNKDDGARMEKLGEKPTPKTEKKAEKKEEKEEPEETQDEASDDKEEEKEVPARSTVSNMTKDEIKKYADEEWDVELSTNDLKDEMINKLFEEIGDEE